MAQTVPRALALALLPAIGSEKAEVFIKTRGNIIGKTGKISYLDFEE